MRAVRLWLLLYALAVQWPAPTDAFVSMTDGRLTTDDELALLAEIVRYGVKHATPVCTNYGWKDGYCLSLRTGTQDPPSALMKLLADDRPPILSASSCFREGFMHRRRQTTDPVIDVQSLQVREDGSVQAKILVYCSVSGPVFRKEGTRWAFFTALGGVVGCGIVPGDCITPPDGVPGR